MSAHEYCVDCMRLDHARGRHWGRLAFPIKLQVESWGHLPRSQLKHTTGRLGTEDYCSVPT